MAAKQKKDKGIAPVDKSETFVSLQKNMNDSDITMEAKLHALYQIQLTDTQIDKIHLLRGELPLEVKDLEDTIQGLKTRVTNLQAEIKDLEKSVASEKIDMENSKNAIAKYEEQRSNVKNNREYDSLSKEIEFQELNVLHSEKKIKEFGFQADDKRQYLQETIANLEGREIDLVNKKKELESIVEETAIEEEKLLKRSEELKVGLDDRMITAYKRVRDNAKNHLAVVTVKRGACGGCFNKIPPQRELDIALSKKIIVCEYCGRIIVSSEFEEQQ